MVAYYQNTGLGLGEIVKRLSLRIYNYPMGKYGASEDDCGEFYLFFYPRLLRLLDKFEDRGKPFEWYFNSVLRWHYKVYCSRKQRDQIRWVVARNLLFWEVPEPVAAGSAPVESPRWGGQIIAMDRFGNSRESTCRRRILYLALKNARHLDEPAIRRISGVTGVGEDHLSGMVEQLRAALYKRELRLHKFYRRQNRVFTRIFLLQRDLLRECDPAAKADIAFVLSRQRTALRSVQRKIRRIRLHPSNREIAELLGIPKGTVDTSLYWLRHQWTDQRERPLRSPKACA
jgi:DNA-directed RNA polymerase specialized sigma24 family protein